MTCNDPNFRPKIAGGLFMPHFLFSNDKSSWLSWQVNSRPTMRTKLVGIFWWSNYHCSLELAADVKLAILVLMAREFPAAYPCSHAAWNTRLGNIPGWPKKRYDFGVIADTRYRPGPLGPRVHPALTSSDHAPSLPRFGNIFCGRLPCYALLCRLVRVWGVS